MNITVFMWHYRAAAAGPPYNINSVIELWRWRYDAMVARLSRLDIIDNLHRAGLVLGWVTVRRLESSRSHHLSI